MVLDTMAAWPYILSPWLLADQSMASKANVAHSMLRKELVGKQFGPTGITPACYPTWTRGKSSGSRSNIHLNAPALKFSIMLSQLVSTYACGMQPGTWMDQSVRAAGLMRVGCSRVRGWTKVCVQQA